MNGEQQYVLLAPQKSARMLWYLTLGCTLLRNPSLFSCKKNQKIHRKQKIRSSHDYYREAENSPNPTNKNHTSVYSSHYATSCFLAKMLHQTTLFPFLLLRNFILCGQNNCRMNIYATCHKICLEPGELKSEQMHCERLMKSQ